MTRRTWVMEQIERGLKAWEQHRCGLGLSFARIGKRLGVSTTTAWQRYWFYDD